MRSAICYVERNPVRTGIVRNAEDYAWSSAASHYGRVDEGVLSDNHQWKKLTEQVDDWSSCLAKGNGPSELKLIRRSIEKGLPCGSDLFIKSREKMIDRSLKFRPPGRPRQEE